MVQNVKLYSSILPWKSVVVKTLEVINALSITFLASSHVTPFTPAALKKSLFGRSFSVAFKNVVRCSCKLLAVLLGLEQSIWL